MLMLFAAPIVYNIFNFILFQALPFLLLLGFCVTIHEFGHLLFAKIFRIPVEKFSIGFGPPLIRKKIGETDFRIAYFPIGGYVKMAGEEEGEVLKKDKQNTQAEQKQTEPGFYDAPIYKRIITVFGGPFFNILSAAFVIFMILLIFGIAVDPYTKIQVEKGSYADKAEFIDGDSLISVNNIVIKTWDDFEEALTVNIDKEITITVIRDNKEISKNLVVKPESLGLRNLVPPILGTIKRNGPAYKAGMKEGNRILKIDGLEVQTWYGVVDIVRKSRGINLFFEWQHGDEIKTANITPASFYDPIADDTIGQIGVIKPIIHKRVAPLQAITLSIHRTGSIVWLTLKIFYQLIIGKISRRAVGGPIAIAKLSAESAQWGPEYLLGLLALISVNLGLINLFPIPALDGGHIILGIIEAIKGKRFSKRTRIIIQQIGYAIILLLIIFVTFNDITR